MNFNSAIVVIFSTLLAGCSSTNFLLENRVACTADGKEAHFVSKWGPVGIAAKIAQADARVLCRPSAPKSLE